MRCEPAPGRSPPGRSPSFAAAAALSLALIGALAPAAAADDLYFADLKLLDTSDPDNNAVRRVGTDGNGLQTLVPVGPGLRGLDVDPAGGMVYWTDVDNFAIRRARLDGTMVQDLITAGLAFPSAIRLNVAAGVFYWGDQTNEELKFANLDGTGEGFILGGTPFFRGIAVDTANSRIYWTVSDMAATGRILRANLDGSGSTVAVPTGGTLFKPGNIALDIPGGKVYWTDAVTKFVRRANLDGSGQEDLFDGAFTGTPRGIALDLAAGLVYWGQDIEDPDSGGFAAGEIRRMNLDGTDQVAFVFGLGSVNDLVLVRTTVACAADFNGEGGVTVQDIFDFLSAYFGNDPRADFNGVGGVTVQDIFDFLSAYFTGCP